MIVYIDRPTWKDFLHKIQHQRTVDQIKTVTGFTLIQRMKEQL